MTLFRAGARTLLASQFIWSGYKAVRTPQPLVPAAQPLVESWLPVIKKYAPEQVGSVIPEDPATLVRVVGGLELLGGLALASGRGRRLGSVLLALSLVPSTLAEYPFWKRTEPGEKAADRQQFLKNVSLLGGVLLAARDTEGKPGLAWRAQTGGRVLAKTTKVAGKALSAGTKSTTDSAVASGTALAGVVAAASRRAQKKAAKQVKAGQKNAAKQAAAAAAATKLARKQAKKKRKDAKKSDRDAARRAAPIKKEAHRKIDVASKNVVKAAKHIDVGQN